ncbi:MAG: 2-C-methyl-D-erythritol 2,4-cyclodiphosphate synthase [Flaviflexus sp.]|nr:2-C-methyl-D-erythritol 2,4-cyclodiphosphate synthase [Flaviflexus sp.]
MGEMPELRVGSAVDVHAFSTEPRPLMLACLELAPTGGLAGHSDADVIAHAAADALLIASGIGELGTVFGTGDPRWSGASGQALLNEALRLVSERGWSIANLTVQLICQRPRFAPHKEAAEEKMSAILGAPVSISATSTDHLGFLGRAEGAAALATVLLLRPRENA